MNSDNSAPTSTALEEFKRCARPPFRFTYPLQIFSDVSVPTQGLDISDLQRRNSFLKYAQGTSPEKMLKRAQALRGLEVVIKQYLHDMEIITVSLMGSYVNPWNPGKNNDIDVNVIYAGERFYHIEIPADAIRQIFPNIPKTVEELEIAAMGDRNAVYGNKTNDPFTSTTGRDNVIPITVAGLWNRDVPIYGRDYQQLPDNEINLLRLAYDLTESAIRRYQNSGLNKPEAEEPRMRKALCRLHEAGVYLEELCSGLGLGSSKISLLQNSLTLDELRPHVDGVLRKTIERYLQVQKCIK